MSKRSLIAATLVAGITVGVSITSRAEPQVVRRASGPGVACLHDESSSTADRLRRQQALDLANAINAAEGRAAQRTRGYVPLAQLGTLPPAPDGFDLHFYTDGDGYLLSLKDSRDPCHYGVFSDEQGFLYEVSPGVPLIAS